MNILHLANTPLSNAPYNLMRVQIEGGHYARLVLHRNTYCGRSRMVFPSDILLQSGRSNREKVSNPDFSREQLFALFSAADIIHCHNYLLDLYVFRIYPELKRYLKSKLVVIQFHSPRASLKNVEKNLRNEFVDRKFVVAQYQVRQFPQATPVPNAIPIHDELFKPIDRRNSPPVITYSPSNTILRGWSDKGFTSTTRTLKKLHKICESRIITDTPYKECLEKKRSADIAIDEVITGSYHLNTLEALSQGQVAICGMDRQCENALQSYTQTYQNPIKISSPDNLEGMLIRLLRDADLLEHLKKESRKFMENHWSTEKLNKFFQKKYFSGDKDV